MFGKSFHGPVKDFKGRFFIHDDEQLNRWKDHLTTVFNRITSGEIPPILEHAEVTTEVKSIQISSWELEEHLCGSSQLFQLQHQINTIPC